MARSYEAVTGPHDPPTGGDRYVTRHFGDGYAGPMVASRLQGYDSSTLSYVDLAVDSNGNLKLAVESVEIGTVDQGTAAGAAAPWSMRLSNGVTFYDARDRNWTITETLTVGTHAVTQSGTWNVNATLAAETTKVIGTVNQGTSPWVVGGPTASGVATTGNPVIGAGINRTTQPTIADGQVGEFQVDTRSRLRVNVGSGATDVVVGSLSDTMNRTGASLLVAAALALDNGTNLERARGNFNTTTGDTGAKVANFLGATQTNINASGAVITLILGAVSGTFTTFQTALQWSPDGGTTWLPLTALGANITTPASGNTIVWNIYPGIATLTPAASGGTAVATQYNYASMILPRTWRFAITLAGTSPSITIASVQVNYVP